MDSRPVHLLAVRRDKHYVTANTSTGLAAHTNYYKAILTALYEVIERDGFAITWMQEIVPQKITIDKDIRSYINDKFPLPYEWHFFDITYDCLGIDGVFETVHNIMTIGKENANKNR